MTGPDRVPVRAADAPPAAGSYSPGIVSGGFLFIAGQGPFDLDGQKCPGFLSR
jgi:enamine deaminase RidA (YjgF/YER057c/UK114 family)